MDWQEIALIDVLVLLVLSGGYIKRLSGAVKTLVVCFDNAIQDGDITKEEWHAILEAGGNVFKILANIVQLIALKKRG